LWIGGFTPNTFCRRQLLERSFCEKTASYTLGLFDVAQCKLDVGFLRGTKVKIPTLVAKIATKGEATAYFVGKTRIYM